MPDDHSEVVPLLPIPNRKVKRFSADDSAGSRVKVGHCQAITAQKSPAEMLGFFFDKVGLWGVPAPRNPYQPFSEKSINPENDGHENKQI
jgi:hypothetical protein